MQFAHLADSQARMAVQNALFFGRGRASSLVVSMVTYTSPEGARVGPTRAELEESGKEVDTITVPLDEMDRARLDGEDEGFLTVHLRRGSDTILGGMLSPAVRKLVVMPALSALCFSASRCYRPWWDYGRRYDG